MGPKTCNKSMTAGEGEGGANWESSVDTYTLPCVKNSQLVGSCCITQGAQPGALWQPERGGGVCGVVLWEGGSRGRGYIYIYRERERERERKRERERELICIVLLHKTLHSKAIIL